MISVVNGFITESTDSVLVLRRSKSDSFIQTVGSPMYTWTSENTWSSLGVDTKPVSMSGCYADSATSSTICASESASLSVDSQDSFELEVDQRCVVIIRNITDKDTPRLLRNLLLENGFLGTFDLIHMPVGATSSKARGYAFVRFHDEGYALECVEALAGLQMQPSAKKTLKPSIAESSNLDIDYLVEACTKRDAKYTPEAMPLIFDAATGKEVLFPSPENLAFLSVDQLKDF